MKCDVVVIGAGPGGSMAAKTAAESGLNVVLLEKRQEIGEPIRCAEGVSIRSELRELITVQPDWISTEVNGVKLHSPNNDNCFMTVDNGGKEGGYILERKIFDRGLALQAACAGAKVLVKTRAIGLIRKDGLCTVSVICQGEPIRLLDRFMRRRMLHAKILQIVAGEIPTYGPMNNTTSCHEGESNGRGDSRQGSIFSGYLKPN
jgi:digeranylgeranylglycerophospholipid reductase